MFEGRFNYGLSSGLESQEKKHSIYHRYRVASFTLMSGEGLRHTDVGVKMNPDQKTVAKHDNIIYTTYREYSTIK